MAKKQAAAITKIAVPIRTSDTECDDRILQLGDNLRALQQVQVDLDAELARVKANAETQAAPLQAMVEGLSEAIEAYCDTHRKRLTDDGKSKSYSFGNGEVSWRNAPASVKLRKVADIVAWLREQKGKWRKFLRISYEVDKQAMLRHVDQAREIPGVTIKSSGEKFYVTPIGLELEQPK